MSTENPRNVELKRFYTGFSEKIKSEITKLVKLGQTFFTSSTQKSNKDEDYDKMTGELLKVVTVLKE